MLMKVRPELEPMQRLRAVLPMPLHGVMEQLVGTVPLPADQPALACVVITLAECLLDYAASIGRLHADFAATLDAVAQVGELTRAHATEIQGVPIAAQMAGRITGYPQCSLVISMPAEASPLRIALGAEIAYAMLTGGQLNAKFCTNLRSGIRQYGRPQEGDERRPEDLSDQGFGRGWFPRFQRIDRDVRRMVESPDPNAPVRPKHARVHHGLDVILRLRWRFDYPDPKHRQGVLDDSHLPPAQFVGATRAVRRRVEAGDAAAIVQALCIMARLPPSLVMSLPLQQEVNAARCVALDLASRTLALNINALFPGRRVPPPQAAHLFEAGGHVLRLPLPQFLAAALLALARTRGSVPLLGDLLGWPVVSTLDVLAEGEVCKLASSLARASKSTPAFAIRAGLNRVVAACLTWDFSIIGSARMYYARMSGQELHQGACALFALMDWGEPANADLAPIGSHAVPTSHALTAMFTRLAEECTSARPGPRAPLHRLFNHHSLYTRYTVRLVTFCLGLRAATVYRLLGKDLRDGEHLLAGHDKHGGDLLMAQHMMLNALAHEQIRQYLAHCHTLLGRLKATDAPQAVKMIAALEAALNGGGPLFVMARDNGSVRPAGARSIWGEPVGIAFLAANCGRHFWQNALRHAGLCSGDIDRFMRHRVLGLESNTTSRLDPPARSFARITAAQETILARIGMTSVPGLRRAS